MDTTSYSDLVNMVQPRKKSFLETSGNVASAIAAGMGEKQYQPQPNPQEEFAKELMKAIIMKKMDDPYEKMRIEHQLKQEFEAQDPYKQSQIAINEEILRGIRGGNTSGAGGDLIYRNQLTGIEIPPTEAIPRIQQGEQFIINRRVTTRQGIKEEKVSEPKSVTEGEVKTSTGAEEVLKEIETLKNIMLKEPTGWGASIPFFGGSAQAQGVKIPIIAPYGVSEKGQEYRTIRESINNRLLYLRSGAQINDKEYQRLSGMLPMIFRSDKVDLQQLERFKSEFGNILQRIQMGRRGVSTSMQPQIPVGMGQPNNEREQAKQMLLQKGYSEQETEQMLGQ